MRCAPEEGYIAVVDDDGHSAHLLCRTLGQAGCSSVRHLGGADFGGARLNRILADIHQPWPSVVIVDLKTDSTANIAFVARHQSLLRQRGVCILVMVSRYDEKVRSTLIDAGAAGVFYRQADRDAYRREVNGILQFWARHQRLDAVGM